MYQNHPEADPRFENLIAHRDVELEETIAGKPGKDGGPRKEDILKRTYEVGTCVALVSFPAGVTWEKFEATDEKPAYYYGRVGGTHLHLVEGVTPEQLGGPVTFGTRIRTAEPLIERPGATRNYELVGRISPATGPVTDTVVVEPARSAQSTIVNEDTGLLVHKGGAIKVTSVAASAPRRRDDRRPARREQHRW